jgi:thymidylate kinase
MLDGVNGAGKSTYAYLLKEKLGINICRVFRSADKKLHWGSTGEELRKELTELKIPINTHADDIFMADFMASFQVDAILDRTIASAIVYGRTYNQFDGWYTEKTIARRLLDFWTSLMDKCKPPLIYIWMDVSYAVATKRCHDRWCPEKKDFEKLKKEYEQIFYRLPMKRFRLDTTNIHEKSDGVDKILDIVK